jgi:type II secretory pathway pseudopilin PulG
MLAVIAILALLIALLMPSLGSVATSGREAKCASNLHQIYVAIIGDAVAGERSYMPSAGTWLSRVADRDASSATLCPEDEIEEEEAAGGWYMIRARTGSEGAFYLRDVAEADGDQWQNMARQMNSGHRIAWVNGRKVVDGNFEQGGNRTPWPEDSSLHGKHGPIRKGELCFGYESDASMVFDLESGGGWVLYPFEGWGNRDYRGNSRVDVFGQIIDENANGHGASSDNYLCYDDGGDGVHNWQADIHMDMAKGLTPEQSNNFMSYAGGSITIDQALKKAIQRQHHRNNPSPGQVIGKIKDHLNSFPIQFGEHGTGSYGMNNLVGGSTRTGTAKILMMDYEKTVIALDGSNLDDFDEELAPRHAGRQNVTYTDGSIRAMTTSQVHPSIHPDLWNWTEQQ